MKQGFCTQEGVTPSRPFCQEQQNRDGAYETLFRRPWTQE